MSIILQMIVNSFCYINVFHEILAVFELSVESFDHINLALWKMVKGLIPIVRFSLSMRIILMIMTLHWIFTIKQARIRIGHRICQISVHATTFLNLFEGYNVSNQ